MKCTTNFTKGTTTLSYLLKTGWGKESWHIRIPCSKQQESGNNSEKRTYKADTWRLLFIMFWIQYPINAWCVGQFSSLFTNFAKTFLSICSWDFRNFATNIFFKSCEYMWFIHISKSFHMTPWKKITSR